MKRTALERVDASWIHGRDHDCDQATLSNKRVAVVGCGALGAAIARLLAEAGLGRFILVDPDSLLPHNTSRHALGQSYLFQNKAQGTARMLKGDFSAYSRSRRMSSTF